MKIAAVTAEYNPFHNGHLYHLNFIREKLNADRIIVLMSGDFVKVRVTGAYGYDLIGELL